VTERAGRPPAARIRLARPSDLDAITRVERLAAVLYAPYGLADHLAELVTPPETVARGIVAGLAWVAEDPREGDVIGTALATDAGSDLHLDEIDVVPARLRRGVGTQLLEAVLAEGRARGHARLTLLTVDFVPWTLGFYARHGFRVLPRAELDERLRRELALEGAGPPSQRSFDGRIVAARSLEPSSHGGSSSKAP
jgi:GNAT superfamily N-acetyltransferase